MNPPDVYDADGRPYAERRHGGRRVDDDEALPAHVMLGYVRWTGRLWRHKAKIGFAFSVLTGLAGCAAGYLRAARDQRSMNDRVTRVETHVAALEDGQRLQQYIMCVSLPAAASAEAHQLCMKIIQKGVSP